MYICSTLKYITMIKQESFTPSNENLIPAIVELAEKENQTKSKMISLLLEYAVKEKTRKRTKKVHPKHNSRNMGESNG